MLKGERQITMTLFRKLLILNLSGVVGAILSLLVVPDSANFWLWAGTVAVVICLLNLLALTQHKLKLTAKRGSLKMALAYLATSFILIGVALAIKFGFR
jgi:hypothetical protein